MRGIGLLLALIVVAAPAHSQTPQSAPAECSGTAPTLHIQQTKGDWHRRRWAWALDSVATSQGDPATVRPSIDPRGIGMMGSAELPDYSEADLRCWGDRGDQLAAYALGLRLGPISSEAHLWLDKAAEGKNVLLENGPGNGLAADVCAPNLDGGDVSCEYGLPEAQAMVGILICAGKRPGSRADGIAWIERAIRGGLWSAAQFRDGYCKP